MVGISFYLFFTFKLVFVAGGAAPGSYGIGTQQSPFLFNNINPNYLMYQPTADTPYPSIYPQGSNLGTWGLFSDQLPSLMQSLQNIQGNMLGGGSSATGLAAPNGLGQATDYSQFFQSITNSINQIPNTPGIYSPQNYYTPQNFFGSPAQ